MDFDLTAWLHTPRAAKTVFGLMLVFVGATYAWPALRSGYIPDVGGGLQREEHPLHYWFVLGVYLALVASGIDLAVSGIWGISTFWG